MSVPHGKNPVTSPHGTDSGPSDDEILDLVAGGRHLAFDLIVARYGGRTRRYLRQIVGTDASLDDLTQEVFVRIFRGAHLRRRKGTFPVWLYRVARSIAVDHIRRAQADRRVRARVEEELQTAPGRSSTPLDRVQSREFEESFQRALASLPEEFRTPFLLREQERLSYDQIAEVLDTSAKTISTRIHRARRRLRGLLAPFLPAYGGGEGGSMSKQDVCQQVLHHASRWADGNLGAATSDAIKTHLARCDGCRIEFAAIRELSRLVRAQAPDGLPDGFAARVRETAVQAGPARPQGRWWRHLAMRRAAAALLVVIGLGWAYHLGREHGSATTSGPGVQPDVPVNVVSFDSPTHLRAARSVASDLGIIDRIPERLRRPLLRAQIDHFELDRWAEEVRRHERAQPTVVELAALIRELSQTLEDPRSGGNILQLRQRALQPNLWSPIPGMMVSVDIDVSSNARKRRHRSVRSAAPDMPEGIHIALGRVLELKEHLADGNPWPFITMQHGEADVSGELRPSIEVALAATLGEAGLDELAVPWLRPLREGSPDVFRVLTSTFFTGKDPLRIELGSIGNLQDRLEKLLRRTRGSGEIVIQETTDDEGFVFKVLFRNESRKKRER